LFGIDNLPGVIKHAKQSSLAQRSKQALENADVLRDSFKKRNISENIFLYCVAI